MTTRWYFTEDRAGARIFEGTAQCHNYIGETACVQHAEQIVRDHNDVQGLREALESASRYIEMLEAKLGKRVPLDLQPKRTKTLIQAALRGSQKGD